MEFIRFFLLKPAIVGAIITAVMVVGLTSLFQIPIQLTPDVETPKLTIETSWFGASPYEIEKEIIIKQEKVLRNLPGLERLQSESSPGRGRIILEFALDTQLEDAILHVSIELDQVTGYPENVKRPRIITSGSNASPIMWTQLRPLGPLPESIDKYLKFAEEEVVPEFEKIPGISHARVFGGRTQEVQILIDTEKLASYHISISQLINRIRQENVDISGGSIQEGKREYIVRTLSKYRNVQDLEKLIIKTQQGQHIYLKNVAEVKIGYKLPRASVLINNEYSLVIPLYREHGANVLEVTEKAIAVIERINKQKLKPRQLQLRRLADQRYYINSAISLVIKNLVLGSVLAFLILIVFLGNLRSAVVVVLSIPISVIGTFFCLLMLGRNINVISLAGMAFAVGMVVDSAIVVLENIDQYRLKGFGLFESALQATHEVWGAILASSLTTVAVFLPVLFVQEKAGQLFADISIAICSAILLSLAVAVMVIPSLYQWLLGSHKVLTTEERAQSKSPYNWIRRHAGNLVELVLRGLQWLIKSWWKTVLCLGITLGLSAYAIYYFTPKLEYLPKGNRNLIFGILIPPSGYNTGEIARIGSFLMEKLEPVIQGKDPNYPQIERIFYVGFGTRAFMGVIAKDPQRVQELIPLMKKVLSEVPGMYAIASQASLFERGLSAGRSIDIELYGDRLKDITQVGQSLFQKIRTILPGSQVRPIPSLEIGTPEIQVLIDVERASELGLSTQELGLIVDVYTDGRKIDEFTDTGGNILDITLASADQRVRSISDFSNLSIFTPTQQRVTLSSVARIVETVGPNQINRIAQERAITLRVSPPEDLSLDEALTRIQVEIVDPALSEYSHVDGFRIELSGTADEFTKTRKALQTGFLVALGITFLLLLVLFEDFLAPLVIMGSLPVAGAGGMIFLALTNRYLAPQSLDVLVMLGFLMLIGIVVNNPILIVHRALYLIRKETIPLSEAIIEAVRSRIRPIFMSTMTSVLGLCPLVLVPGAGSELYRGLGSALLGGLLLSTFVSIFFVPLFFALMENCKSLFRPSPSH